MNIKKISEEIFYTQDAITKVKRSDLELLKAKASENSRKRLRLCNHRDTEDAIHEMLIILAQDTYIRPHRHLGKMESFHIIEGRLKVVIFGEQGDIREIIRMGDYASEKVFYYRLSESRFHTVIPGSDFVVFHETTPGPFHREDTLFAPWAPEDEQEAFAAQRLYLDKLNQELVNKG